MTWKEYYDIFDPKKRLDHIREYEAKHFAGIDEGMDVDEFIKQFNEKHSLEMI